MERKIGDTFEYEGHKLKVTDEDLGCHRCFFYTQGCIALKMRGSCTADSRTDRKSVIFVEVKDEQPQEQAEQSLELNLCEALKYCPQGEMFWSPMLGDVELRKINHEAKRIYVIEKKGSQWWINADATMTFGGITSVEIMLYPSREQRDWSKFTAPWYKKERFDPKTLQPFDKVLVRDSYKEHWLCRFFSHIVDEVHIYKYITIGSTYKYCIPYNDDTKHLVGTTEEAPEFYKYRED